MEKNGKNGTFFYKERKRTERMEHSYEKNGCPTLKNTDPKNICVSFVLKAKTEKNIKK